MGIIIKYAGKIWRFFLYMVSLLLSFILPVIKKRTIFWSVNGKSYSCNPRYISEYCTDHNELGFDVYWAFENNHYPTECHAKKITIGSFAYLIIINTAEFIVTNHRVNSRSMYWRKRKRQKYIMTWHGTTPLKLIEKDAISVLGESYAKLAIKDSHRCNLIISDSNWFSNTIRRAFWYNGEILHTGAPRNDIYYSTGMHATIRNKVSSFYGIPEDSEIVLYTPTFRTDHNTDVYVKTWRQFINVIEDKTKKGTVVLIRLHPGLKGKISFEIDDDFGQVIDVTEYCEIQELIIAADMMITDFSSTMFEFSLLNKPCFLVAEDLFTYNRGLYFTLDELPFIKYTSIINLSTELMNINLQQYSSETRRFVIEKFNPICTINASRKVVEWMNSCS